MSVLVTQEAPDQEFFFDKGILARFPEMKVCLAERGSFVLRDAIDSEKIYQYRELVEKTHHIYVGRCADKGIDYRTAPSDWQGREGWEGIAHALRLGQINPGWLTHCFPDNSIYHLVSEDLLLFVAYFFGAPYRKSQSTHTRWLSPDQGTHREGFDHPVEWHVDAQHHGTAEFTINLWIPLQDCGLTRPGLQAAILPIARAQALAGFNSGTGAFEINEALRLNGDPSVPDGVPAFAPAMRAGDIFVMTHWTLHATYAVPKMTERRLSAELRFSYPSSIFPEALGPSP